MIRFLKKAHRILYFTSVLVFFIPCYPFLWYFSRKSEKYFNHIVFLRKWISIISTHAVGIRFKIHYEEQIDWSRPYVICPNHTSILDIAALTYLCPQAFSFIGKIELLKNPVTRIFFKSTDIVVNRSSKISSFKAFRQGVERLREGKSLVIFPEGKIDDEYPPRLHEFKSGPFRMATDNHIPLLPVVIHNAWQIMWDDGQAYGSKPGIIHVSILKPIETNQDVQAKYDTFEDEVFNKMNNFWQQKSRL